MMIGVFGLIRLNVGAMVRRLDASTWQSITTASTAQSLNKLTASSASRATSTSYPQRRSAFTSAREARVWSSMKRIDGTKEVSNGTINVKEIEPAS